jgi:hypothetical protein
LGRFFITDVANIFGAFFSTVKSYVTILTKTGWATFWAIFFTDSSGHPESKAVGSFQ